MNNFQLEGVAVRLIKERPLISNKSITCPKDLISLMGQDMMDLDREEVRVIYFDTKSHPLAYHQVSIGSLNASIVNPREIFKAAILLNADGIMLFHNHPSDDETPSDTDNLTTDRIHKACGLMGLTLFDHIIITPSGKYYSYYEKASDYVKTSMTYSEIGVSVVPPELPGLSLVAEG